MGSTRSITAEIIVAIVVALISIFLFLDVPVLAKIALILVLTTIGILNFAALVGWTTKVKWKLWAWRSNRKIRQFPGLITDLYRLNRKIHAVLYERNADHPSLAMQGLETVQILSKELGEEDASLDEFKEKFEIMQTTYTPTWNKIVQYSRGHRWTTLEFAETLQLVNLHLDALGRVFKTVYREAELYAERGNVVPLKAASSWRDFVKDLNPVLQEWKTFTEKAAEMVGGYGIDASRSDFAKDIP